MNKRKTELPIITVVIMALIIIIANLILGFLLVEQSKKSMKSLIESRMLDVVNVAADMINGDDLVKLKIRDKNDEIFNKINSTLTVFQNNIELKYIYTVRDEGNNKFTFIIDPSEDSGNFGEEVVYTDALYQASLGTPSVDKEPYTDAWGRFYSAYSPVFDSSGKVAGIVACDFDADWYDNKVTGEIRSIVIGVIISLLFCLIFLFSSTAYTRGRLRSINADMKRAAEERENLTAELNKALLADYYCVHFIDLDKDEAVCYKETGDPDDFKTGEHFPYHSHILKYTDKYVTEDYREEFLRIAQPNAIRERLKKDPAVSFIYLMRKQGQELYVKINFARVNRPGDPDDGLVHAAALSISDVDSETRFHFERNRELKDALERAEKANESKAELLVNISREIRVPLREMVNSGRKALEESDIPDEIKAKFNETGEYANQLLAIVDDVLDLSSIEAGKIRLKHEVFSFPNLIEHLRSQAEILCRKKNVTFDYRPNDIITRNFVGDPVRIRQALMTILSNAVKFTPEGGTVSFDYYELSRRDSLTVVRFNISDSGRGLSPGLLEKIFEPFNQGDYIETECYGGTGLGMPITKSIIELMDGSVIAQSEEGKGTGFTITLPLYEA
ncbi:MAG: sensor histidine kinase [Lachnospiraceae bacterium]|nr:sensor histidine kinase [Lachnospiraceae bacterium]